MNTISDGSKIKAKAKLVLSCPVLPILPLPPGGCQEPLVCVGFDCISPAPAFIFMRVPASLRWHPVGLGP